MKEIILLGLFVALSVALAQRNDGQEQQRQQVVRTQDSRQQIRYRTGASDETIVRGNGQGNFENGQFGCPGCRGGRYGCPGCRGGQYGRRGPGWRRGWRGSGPNGQGQGYGPRWGSGSRGPHRMSDFFGMRGNEGDMNYGPMHHGMRGQHHRGFFRGHGHGHRYMDEYFCPTSCPQTSHPVCGSDGQTYENMCALRMQACRTEVSLTAVRRGRC